MKEITSCKVVDGRKYRFLMEPFMLLSLFFIVVKLFIGFYKTQIFFLLQITLQLQPPYHENITSTST